MGDELGSGYSEEELGMLLREQRRQEASDRERELNFYRSGSAPPTVEGSLAAKELRSTQAYLNYYYSHVNLNPRLPPPVLSKEDWRSTQRLQVGRTVLQGIGDTRKAALSGKRLDKGGEGLIGLSLSRQMSFANVLQDDVDHKTPISNLLPRPQSSFGAQQPGDYVQSGNGLQNASISFPYNLASAGDLFLGKGTTPDPQSIARASSPCFAPFGPKVCSNVQDEVESDDYIAALSGFCLSNDGAASVENISQSRLRKELDDHQKFLFDSLSNQGNFNACPIMENSDAHSLKTDPIEPHRSTISSANSYVKSYAPPDSGPGGSPGHFQNIKSVDACSGGIRPGDYSVNPVFPPSMLQNHVAAETMPNLFESAAAASAIGSLTIDCGTSDGAALQTPINDPLYVQYLKAAEYTTQIAASCSEPSVEMGYMGNSYAYIRGIQKAHFGLLLQQQKQYGNPHLGKSGSMSHSYYGNSTLGLGSSYPGSPLTGQIASPVGPGSPLRLGELPMQFPCGLRHLSGGIMGSWHSDRTHKIDQHYSSSLREEFKNNKNRCFELADIAGHVVEFSADQYGSRFIQQKLETATSEERNMVFKEIMPHSLSLTTDVFGNYVVQKLFEYGSMAQRRELASQLNGHVLALSLQMYGCRVIQKAIGGVDLDQKKKIVLELDGHILRCVRDQNGNHVIQKCIECIPQDEIQFVISAFYDQVVTLSTHPYGCRVIQRVLEFCDDPQIQQSMMGEILQSVCLLAQDQYGNYVVQHVLEHGKPHERSAIVKEFAGQIVQMSLQKFASNVVEKCLTFGSPEERQILVNEMLGSTDKNEPLQVMMKDQFANYVVQKALETCDDEQRELILSRIKVHLNALKKYTYGKHIVARIEKLVAAGERRIGLQTQHASYGRRMRLAVQCSGKVVSIFFSIGSSKFLIYNFKLYLNSIYHLCQCLGHIIV
ncbi:unnamed protein product [Musa acuminata subsp. malaccensis]|uniref:(wild Malaysian banana) hypothetical protein n=1 Tax=Musa acuminata subsp. malaccensis TaxID=214687 RepID=A0A804HNB0_MUSAM|nr:unnamed protein product [Musa acuminata subsp. malaccensis]